MFTHFVGTERGRAIGLVSLLSDQLRYGIIVTKLVMMQSIVYQVLARAQSHSWQRNDMEYLFQMQ